MRHIKSFKNAFANILTPWSKEFQYHIANIKCVAALRSAKTPTINTITVAMEYVRVKTNRHKPLSISLKNVGGIWTVNEGVWIPKDTNNLKL